MPSQYVYQARMDQRVAQEKGTLRSQGRRRIALVYPSPYHVGMSSLGYQTIYRLLNQMPDTMAERSFLPDPDESPSTLLTYESRQPAGNFPVIAFSVAYELETMGVLTCLTQMGLPVLRTQRRDACPWVVMGGPLTFSNPAPLSAFADIVVMGEAEDILEPLLEGVFSQSPRQDVLRSLADQPGFYIPSVHEGWIPPVAQCNDRHLPACSAIVTPQTVLSDMFLLEAARGCSRGCRFCVMRRSTNGGMRVVPMDRLLASIPKHAQKVGFVGAAVSDHPKMIPLLRYLVEAGKQISLSSLRADRLTPEFIELLVRGGYKTLTVASDGASERLRAQMEKKIHEKHLLRAAEYARVFGVPQLKNYMMVGVPGETDADLDELIDFTLKQADVAGPQTRVSLGIAPFVAKRNTPWDGLPFIGIAESDRRLERLRRGLVPRVEVRPTSSRWAWVEYMLSQGGPETGLAALQAWQDGGSFAAWKRALKPPRRPISKRMASQGLSDRSEGALKAMSACETPREGVEGVQGALS